MNIRALRHEDIESVIDLVDLNYTDVMPKVHSRDVLEKFKAHNTTEDWMKQMTWKEIFVVEEKSRVIATGALANFGTPDAPKHSLSNFFVLPSMQGKGTGTALARHMVCFAADRGITVLHVPSSRIGYDFYRKFGFVKDDVQNDEADEITWMTLQLV